MNQSTSTTLSPGTAAAMADAEQLLSAAAAVRQSQLDGLPPSQDDQVVAAQRAGLEQTLRDIASARARLAEGSYGSCTRCGTTIAAGRLELRPWSDLCVDCAGR